MASTIILSKSLITHGGEITQIDISEPRGLDYLSLGEPVTYGRTVDGGWYTIENEEVIRAYIEKCVQKGVNIPELEQFSLEDAMQIKAAILDFFRAARGRASAKSSTGSSSTSL